MQSDREAFERAVMDAPNDAAPRLVFADWLDEHGDAKYAAALRMERAGGRVRRFASMNTRLMGTLREIVVYGTLSLNLKTLPLPLVSSDFSASLRWAVREASRLEEEEVREQHRLVATGALRRSLWPDPPRTRR